MNTSLLLLALILPIDAPSIQDANQDDDQTVTLKIVFNGKSTDGNRPNKTQDLEIKDIQWVEGMTILSAMTSAQKAKKVNFKYRGKGITAFLTEINQVKNEGAAGDNWIFRVNNKLGKKSFGVSKLKPGDKVIWSFGKYRPNGK